MGLYDSGTYAAFDNPYSQERADARTQLAQKLAEREQKMQGYQKHLQSEDNLTYGDDVAKGAMLGTMINPGWGTAIGAGAGALLGGGKAFAERRHQGQGVGRALLGTAGDLFSSHGLGAALGSPSAAPAAAMLGQARQAQQTERADTSNYGVPTIGHDQFGNETAAFSFQDPNGSPVNPGEGHFQTAANPFAAQPQTGYGSFDPNQDEDIAYG